MVTYDLDFADLPEVRRRVVDPAVALLLAPHEVQEVRLVVGTPPWASGPEYEDDDPEVWVEIRACGEEFGHRLGKMTRERWDAEEQAGLLAEALQEFIAESAFGWGQLRPADVAGLVPAPLPPPPTD